MRPLYKFLIALVGIGVGLALLFTYVLDTWSIPNDDPILAASILPRLEPGDLLIVRRGGEPRVGHMVRCTDPEAPARFVLARLVAGARSTVAIEKEFVTVDSKRDAALGTCDQPAYTMLDPRTGTNVNLVCWREPFLDITLETLRSVEAPEADHHATMSEGRGFLVSDNRHIHLDSRDFHEVDLSTCTDVLFRLWGSGPGSGKFSIVW